VATKTSKSFATATDRPSAMMTPRGSSILGLEWFRARTGSAIRTRKITLSIGWSFRKAKTLKTVVGSTICFCRCETTAAAGERFRAFVHRNILQMTTSATKVTRLRSTAQRRQSAVAFVCTVDRVDRGRSFLSLNSKSLVEKSQLWNPPHRPCLLRR
jgi:hypothetical protein